MKPKEAAENLINGNISTVKKWLKAANKIKMLEFIQHLRLLGESESEVYMRVLLLLDKW